MPEHTRHDPGQEDAIRFHGGSSPTPGRERQSHLTPSAHSAAHACRVLFAPETINLAEVTRGIEVAKRMPPGVDCVFTGFSPRNSDLIKDAGFEFILQEPRLTGVQARQGADFEQARGPHQPFSRSILAQRVASERALIRRLCASAVVIGATQSQFISARAESVPLVFVRPFAYSQAHLRTIRRLGATGFLPRETGRQQLADAAAARLLYLAGTRVPLPRPFYQVAANNGVSLPRSITAGLTADLNLITTAPHLLPAQLELPADHKVTGPVYTTPGEVPGTISQLAAGSQPVIYFAVGSSGNRELVLTVLKSLGNAPYQVLAPVRSHLYADDLPSLPANIHVTDRLPADRLGDAVDLAITHGGEETVQTSCAQGWPFIGIPLQLEQRFNVQRCVAFGCARLVSQRDVSSTSWSSMVQDVLADTTMRRRARHMARLMSELDGPGQAAKAIMELLEGPGAGTGITSDLSSGASLALT